MSISQNELRTFKVSMMGTEDPFFIIRRARDEEDAKLSARNDYPVSRVTSIEKIESEIHP